MTEQPEDRDLAGFIIASGGMGKAVLRILARDHVRAIANFHFWGLLIHWLFLHAYIVILVLGIPLSLAYFLYVAFWSDVNERLRHGALTSIIVVGVLGGLLGYIEWKGRSKK